MRETRYTYSGKGQNLHCISLGAKRQTACLDRSTQNKARPHVYHVIDVKIRRLANTGAAAPLHTVNLCSMTAKLPVENHLHVARRKSGCSDLKQCSVTTALPPSGRDSKKHLIRTNDDGVEKSRRLSHSKCKRDAYNAHRGTA
jgi:hypothetical protein